MENSLVLNKSINYLKVSTVFHILIFSLFFFAKDGSDLFKIIFSFTTSVYLLLLFPSTLILNIVGGWKRPVHWVFAIGYIISHSAYTMAIFLRLFAANKVEWSFPAQASAVILFLVLLPTLIRNFDRITVKLFMFSSILFYFLYMFL